VAAALRKIPGLNVELSDGQKGEFTVLVDGQEVARKGNEMPTVDEVVTAVKNVALAKQRV
jgi:hypothetical protein